MVARLSTQNGGGQTAAPQQNNQPQGSAPITPKGWGKPAGGAQTDVEHHTNGAGHPDQRQRIQEQIAPQDAAKAAFSGQVHQATDQVRHGDYGQMADQGGAGQQQQDAPFEGGKPVQEQPAPAQTGRRRRAPAATEAAAPAQQPGTGWRDPADAIEYAGLMKARAIVMQGVIVSDPNATVADIIETTRELMEFIIRG